MYMCACVLVILLLFAWTPANASPGPQDDACLACHGEAGMKSASGKRISIDPAKHKESVHSALGCQTCHADIKDYPHPKRVAAPQCATCHADEAATVAKSNHGLMFGATACAQCHGNAHEFRATAKMTAGQACSACHKEILDRYRSSIHFQARKNGDQDTPLCVTCHGPAHQIVPRTDPSSPVAKENLPHTCAACHANPDFLSRHNIPFARPVEAFKLSVHGRALARGNTKAASCADCHSSHETLPGRDPKSKINHWNVPQTCGACHQSEQKAYVDSVHGTAVARSVSGAPVCTDCHGEHIILAPSEPQSLVNPARVSSVTCGRCHNDERLTSRYNLPFDKVPAFEDSFHGLAMRSGSQTVANCASCHGVHNILPSTDARSTIHPANLAKTCGACHPGAGQRFTIERVHVQSAGAFEHIVVKWIRVTYVFALIPFTLAFMLLHNLLDFFAKLRRGVVRPAVAEEVPRMNLNFRIAHWMVMVSFPVLVITGFALKYPEAGWAAPLLIWESSFAFRGWVHRVSGVVLVISMLYHFTHLLVVKSDRGILRHLLPRWTDARDLWLLLRFNLGWAKERPHFPKFSYAEKVEYWAFIWGTVVMAASGFFLWFNNVALRNFPKWISDAATAIHFYEAVLATFSILIWHFYLVIFDPDVYPMEKAWLNGKVSAEHLRHTRPAYYAALVRAQREKEQAAQRKSDSTKSADGKKEAGTSKTTPIAASRESPASSATPETGPPKKDS